MICSNMYNPQIVDEMKYVHVHGFREGVPSRSWLTDPEVPLTPRWLREPDH
ncbi:hypothetical protein MKX50_18630 [Paenibacillus sp. FSL W8-0186]|uniref:hypothetical protein n=1 Tax=Paenibacillus sp. FSL W8-0186 TaxID=2921709 RepID=UPI0030CDC2CF